MKLGILAAGITPDDLISEFGSFADMFVQLFNQTESCFEYEIFDVRDGFFPDNVDRCDCWIITGSICGVNENLPWMETLKQLILDVYEAKIPMAGICFGHQIIADAFGGKVEKYEGGWGIGLHRYTFIGEDNFFINDSADFTLNAMHQDQVITKPANAEVFATSDFCKYAGLIYNNRVITFQAHPEFSVAFEESFIESRKGDGFPSDVAEQGLATLRQKDAATEALRIAQMIVTFLKKNIPSSNTP